MSAQETIREDRNATVRENQNATVREEQNAAATLREGQTAAGMGGTSVGSAFQGYRVVRQLPTKGSEADIFVVEKDGTQYILKQYRYGINPKRDILLDIKALSESHPHEFVRLFDADFDPASGRWYEIQEYVPNGSLQSLMADRSPLTDAQQATFFNDVACELADALHALHQNNLLHLDLKPSNILLRSIHPLNLVLIDFGIATSLASDMSKKFTQVRGTPMYQSPESYSGGMGRPADWWGLGMILLEIAAGAHPFKGLINNIIAYAIATEPVEIPENLDAGRKELLRGLLTRNPEKRWSYEQVARWLAGERGIPEHFESVPAAQMQSSPSGADLKPIKFIDRQYQILAELAAAFLKDEQAWEKGREFLMRGYVRQWLEKNEEFDAIVDMDKVMSGTEDPDEKLFRFTRRFGGDVPFAFGGHLITLENLLLFAGKVLKRQPVTAMERKIADTIANGVLLSCLDFYKQQGRLSERLRDLELVLETVKGKSQEQVAKILDAFIHPENYAPTLNGNMTIQEIAQKVEMQEQERREQERKRFASPSDKVWTNSMGDNSTVASDRVDSDLEQSLTGSVSGEKTGGKAPVPAPQPSGGGWKRLGLAILAVLLLAGLAAWHFGSGTFKKSRTTPPSEPASPSSPVSAAPSKSEPQPKPSVNVTPPVHKLPTYKNSIGMEFVKIPAGRFWMGSSDGDKKAWDNEKPRHEVEISRSFYLGKYEVTQEQWEKVMGNNPSRFEGEDRPVEKVSWNDAQEFIAKLNAQEGHKRYRLPTEAEWEYAARAGSGSAYCFGNDRDRLGDYAWYGEYWNSGSTHPVGQLRPNAWGLHDMHGNVCEWVQDWYGGYSADAVVDPQGPSMGENHVRRGGSWGGSSNECRSANRFNYVRGIRDPVIRSFFIGFRLALSPEH